MALPLTKDAFERTLNTRFWLLDDGGQPYALDLIEVENGYSSPRQEQFSLRFRGESAYVFPQRIYPLRHNTIGDFDLFLVPIGRDQSGTTYEAVFNRLIQPSHLERPA